MLFSEKKWENECFKTHRMAFLNKKFIVLQLLSRNIILKNCTLCGNELRKKFNKIAERFIRLKEQSESKDKLMFIRNMDRHWRDEKGEFCIYTKKGKEKGN
jgi:hypothetical protein